MTIRQTLSSLKNHLGVRRYAINTFWMFAESSMRNIAALLVGIWVARYLGPEKYGIYHYSISFAVIFSEIAKLGLDGIMVRELVNHPEKRDAYLGTSFWMKTIGSIFMLAAIAIAMIFANNDATTNLYIFIIAAGFIFQGFDVINFYFQARVLYKYVSVCKIIQIFISSVIKVYLVLTGADLIWFVTVSLIDQVSAAITLFIAYYGQHLGHFYYHFDAKIARHLLKDSWPLILSGMVIMIYMRIDQVMIKEIVGAKEVGLYAAAQKLSEALFFFFPILINSLYAAVLNAKQHGPEEFKRRVVIYFAVITHSCILCTLFLFFFAGDILYFSFGDKYNASLGILKIHLFSNIFAFLGGMTLQLYLLENLTKLTFFRTACGAALNIILNWFLIHKYGAAGAALSAVITQFLVGVVFVSFFKQTRGIFFLMLEGFLFPVTFFFSKNNHKLSGA